MMTILTHIPFNDSASEEERTLTQSNIQTLVNIIVAKHIQHCVDKVSGKAQSLNSSGMYYYT